MVRSHKWRIRSVASQHFLKIWKQYSKSEYLKLKDNLMVHLPLKQDCVQRDIRIKIKKSLHQPVEFYFYSFFQSSIGRNWNRGYSTCSMTKWKWKYSRSGSVNIYFLFFIAIVVLLHSHYLYINRGLWISNVVNMYTK